MNPRRWTPERPGFCSRGSTFSKAPLTLTFSWDGRIHRSDREPPRQRQRGRPLEMGEHMRRGGRGVAQDCAGDCAVLARRGFEDLRGPDVVDLGHNERQMEPRRDLAQLQVVGERHHRVMEGGVLREVVQRATPAIVKKRPQARLRR
jgi:hypothetical protein